MPTTNTGRPALVAAAATCAATGPPPAMMVSGSPSAIVVLARPLDAAARRAERAVAACPDELDHGHHRRHVAELRRDRREPLVARSLAAEDRLIGGAERVNRAPVETAALQPDNVEAAERGMVDHENVVADHAI